MKSRRVFFLIMTSVLFLSRIVFSGDEKSPAIGSQATSEAPKPILATTPVPRSDPPWMNFYSASAKHG